MTLSVVLGAASAARASADIWAWQNPLPQGATMSGVSCPASNYGKAVGASGTILSWNGSTWSAESSATAENLNGVGCVADDDCKAVGDNGAVVSWNETSWSTDASGRATR